MSKTYKVTYKIGRTEVVKGNIVLFNNTSTSLPQLKDSVYLNANEVMSIIEIQETPREEV